MAAKEPKSKQFFRLYTAAQSRIYAFLLSLVHNHSDAEDLLQETASILWENFDQFDRTKSFSAWAIGIARNKAFDFLKSKKASRPLFNEQFYRDISRIAEQESESAPERLKALRQCMKKMSPSNQKLINLRFEQGVGVKQISQATGHSADAIYKRISRIYSALENCISRSLVSRGQI
ncbi:RNA polymerase sigma factor SigX [Anaerohalosphaera lusitana]|uniref:RNA polymerase sigma factor SigX n=1 Tax=Anaerohalosphaera lusitana TaxID=1936003 RepID=A0A1U9NNB1_9BACT|nr:sigma-70 family RNA polymerase sigma factor [Anaerohalosphaera lusitana]AQT69218.1 RNA polymerase sigma factor SigX [Anaerohalosphaera lusitana]